MSGCILRLSKNFPLRTTLVDQATGQAKYQIETPMKIARSVTRIRKFEVPTEPPLHWDEDDDSDSGDEIIDKGEKKEITDAAEEAIEVEELQESSDEIGRIYWNWFSSNKIIFRGRITTRDQLLPKCGKLKG
jgi:hypothetical protein